MGSPGLYLIIITLICTVILIILVICILCVWNEAGCLPGSSIRGRLQQLEVCLPLVCRAEHLKCYCHPGRLQRLCGASSNSESLPPPVCRAEGSISALLLPQRKLAACGGAPSV